MSDRRREADEEEDDEWLFDSIVGYLSSPIWKIPIEHFYEQNCSIFSPEDDLTDDGRNRGGENIIPAEYLEAHIKYKNLVDALINSFLQDIGVTYKQFLRACRNSSRFTNQPVYLELFEQIWATENINIFKSQMIRKNVELELQALLLLQLQLGIVKKSGETKGIDDSDEIMAMIIKKSKDEFDKSTSSSRSGASASSNTVPEAVSNKKELDTAKKIVYESDHIEKSLQQEINQQAYLSKRIVKKEIKSEKLEPAEQPIPVVRPQSARKNLANFEKLSINDNDDRPSSRMRREVDKPSEIVSSMAQAYISKGATSEEEIKRRAEFMEKQRALLTEKKRVEREKQLENYMYSNQGSGNTVKNVRPMSSRAARSVLQGAESDDIPQSHLNTKSVTDEERKRQESRRALAETLKKEVINQSRKN